MKEKLKDKWLTSLSVAALFSFTLFFLGPAYLYYTNVLEFPYLFSEIRNHLLVFSALITVFISTLLVYIPLRNSLYIKLVSTFFALGVLFWVQGNVLVWNYGILDGREIIWGDYLFNGLIDTTIWIVIFVLVLMKSLLIYPFIRKISLFLLIIQFGGLLVTSYTAPDQPSWSRYSIDDSSMFDFSTNKNVIILVLDTFQADVFQEIINEEEHYKEALDGFTFYRNSLGGYPTTYASIPLILTGEYYDNSISVQKFIESTFKSNSLPKNLKENDFKVEFYPFMANKTLYYDKEIASNFIEKNNTVSGINSIKNLYRLSLFRYAPHFAKKHFHGTTSELTKTEFGLSDLEFYNKMSTEVNVSSEENVFKFYHLQGSHPPFYLNEKLQHDKLPQNRDGFKIQSKASLKIANKLIDKLIELGIYDDTMIIITADHGMRNAQFGLNVGDLPITNGYDTISKVPDRVVTGGLPLVLVKPFNSKGALQVSDAPVTLGDIPKTVLSELNIYSDHFPGESMLGLKESENRERRYFHYDWSKGSWDREFLPPMEEYIINGFSWFGGSWKSVFKEYTSNGIVDIQVTRYSYGEDILYGTEGNEDQYLLDGWGAPENKFRWTNSTNSILNIPIELTTSNLELKFEGHYFNEQTVDIIVNGHHLGRPKIEELKDGILEHTIGIPNEYVKDSNLIIEFELPNAVSPLELGLSDDVRDLGIGFRSLTITETDSMIEGTTQKTYSFGDVIEFTKGVDIESYLMRGWSGAEETFTWTDGEKASLSIPVTDTESDLTLKLEAHALLLDEKLEHQSVNVYVNGEKIGEWSYNEQELQEKIVDIPNELITDSVINITFELPDATSPLELGLSSDPRILGIAVRSMVLYEKD